MGSGIIPAKRGLVEDQGTLEKKILISEHVSHSFWESARNYSRNIDEYLSYSYISFSPGADYERKLIELIDGGLGIEYSPLYFDCIEAVRYLLNAANKAVGRDEIVMTWTPSMNIVSYDNPADFWYSYFNTWQRRRGLMDKVVQSVVDIKVSNESYKKRASLDWSFILGLDYETLDRNNSILGYWQNRMRELETQLADGRITQEEFMKLSKDIIAKHGKAGQEVEQWQEKVRNDPSLKRREYIHRYLPGE